MAITFTSLFKSVFLLAIVTLKLGDTINTTLFTFTNPCNCKRNEYYDLDSFSCSTCDSEGHLQPTFDKFSCECKTNYSIVAYYDSLLQQPICNKPCLKSKDNECKKDLPTLIKHFCNLKFINYTIPLKRIQINPFGTSLAQTCSCDQKYNHLYYDYCIWRQLLKAYIKYDIYAKRSSIYYTDLKIVVFFCQSLQNKTACSQLANLCVHSFFDTDKNSPCSIFLLAQATDVALYSNVQEELYNLRPLLFYRKGKNTMQELAKSIAYSSHNTTRNGRNSMQLFTTTYLLSGELKRWGELQPYHVNLCGSDVGSRRDFLKQFKISCRLSLASIMDLASLFADKYFLSIFVNFTENNVSSMQTIPVLIKNAFEGNQEPNAGEWQLVKRFQLISAERRSKVLPNTLPYEDDYKLKTFKTIRILRKFELRLFFLDDKHILMPLITLSYHHLNISNNISLSQMYQFDLVCRHESAEHFGMVYNICLPIFLLIAFILTLFRSYIFKTRRNLKYCDIIVALQFLLYIISYMGDVFLITFALDAIYTILLINIKPGKLPLVGRYNTNTFDGFIYFTFVLKTFDFAIRCWRLTKVGVFFVDWEKPKGSDGSVNLKSNLETSSQCSSIRVFSENNVSTWRIFFIANGWVELCGKQRISNFGQGFLSATLYWIIKDLSSLNPQYSMIDLFIGIITFLVVYMAQCLVKNVVLDKVFGSPLQKFVDTCTIANISIFAFLDSSFGFYIHGRSPHGFSDTDISSIIWQLQRESQNMCGKRGLLTDSDFQTYIMLPPLTLKAHVKKFLESRRRSTSVSQTRFQKDLVENVEGKFEKNANSFNRINRFLCAFIDHAIKDLDYIIKERTFMEELLDCEFNRFFPEQQGVFYIDKSLTFSSLFLYGNHRAVFMMELSLFIALTILTHNIVVSIIITCIFNMLFQELFRYWIRSNIAKKTFVDKRFLM